MAQGPSVYGIDTAPLNIQGVNPNVIGQPLQYNPLNFQVPLQLARMRQQERMNESTIAIREKELAMRQKVLDYELAAEERKLMKEAYDMLYNSYMGGGKSGGGGNGVSFGGGVPGSSGDFKFFNESPINQRIAEQRNEAYQKSIQGLQEWASDGNVTDYDNQNYTSLMGDLMSNATQMYSNPDYNRLNLSEQEVAKWFELYNQKGGANDIQNVYGAEQIWSKIAEINSKDSYTQQDAQDLRQLLLENQPQLDRGRIDEYMDQMIEKAAHVYSEKSYEISEIPGTMDEITLQWQNDVKELTSEAVDNLIENPYYRKLLLNDDLVTRQELDEYDALVEAASTGDAQAMAALEDFKSDDLNFMKLKTTVSARFEAENLYGNKQDKFRTITGNKNIPTNYSGSGRGGGKAGPSFSNPFGLNEKDVLNMWGKENMSEAARSRLVFGDDWEGYQAYMDQYAERTENIDSCVKSQMSMNPSLSAAQARALCTEDQVDDDGKIISRGLPEPTSLNKFKFDLDYNRGTSMMNEGYSTTTSSDKQGKLESEINAADDTTPINDEGLTKRTVLSDVKFYQERYFDKDGNEVILDQPMDVFDFLSEHGFVYGEPYLNKDNQWKQKVLYLDDQDIKIMTTESGLNPYKVSIDNNGKFSVGLYQSNGKGGAKMMQYLADQLPDGDREQVIKDKVSELMNSSTGDFKTGISKQDVEAVMAELVHYDPGWNVAHQKLFWEKNWLEPKKELFDRMVSAGGDIKVTLPNGDVVPISSTIAGFDYMLKATATNHGDYKAFMGEYAKVISEYKRANGRPPKAEEAIELMGWARKRYASNYIYSTEAGRFYLNQDNLDKQGISAQKYEEFRNRLVNKDGNKYTDAQISQAITNIVRNGGVAQSALEKNLIQTTTGAKLWAGAQGQARRTLLSWAERVNQETSDALAMLSGNFQREYTLPPEMTADRNVDNPNQAPGQQQGGAGPQQGGAGTAPPPGSVKIDKLNQSLFPTENQDIVPEIGDINSQESTIPYWDNQINKARDTLANFQDQLDAIDDTDDSGFGNADAVKKKADIQRQIKQKEGQIKALDKQRQSILQRQERIQESMNNSFSELESAEPGSPIQLPITSNNYKVQASRGSSGKYYLKIGNAAPESFDTFEEFEKRVLEIAVKNTK